MTNQQTYGPYTDYEAAHQKALHFQMRGAKNILIRKHADGWMIYYVTYAT